jgi:SET domain-containing protein
MTKKQLLKQLKENTFCRIMPSKIHGVGVFAIRNIPKGTNIFKGSCSHKNIPLTQKDIKELDPAIRKMLKDFFVQKGEEIFVPECALNGIDISYFLNFSKNPNVKAYTNGEKLIAKRTIRKGEELTCDYERDYGEKFIPTQ